jgi:hypothetical protein
MVDRKEQRSFLSLTGKCSRPTGYPTLCGPERMVPAGLSPALDRSIIDTLDASPCAKWRAFTVSPTGSASTRPNGTARAKSGTPFPLLSPARSPVRVASALRLRPERPAQPVDLGDAALLYMEMSEAAEHFGVAPPIGRRDRKSGAKKRKQHEIEAARVVHG